METLKEELKAMRQGAGLYVASACGQLLIEGPDAPAFLQRLLTNEVLKLSPGEGRYNALLDRKGMVLSLFYLLRTGEASFMTITPPSLTQKTAGILTKMKFLQKVTITDESEKRGLLWLLGPHPASGHPLLSKERVRERSGLIWKDEVFGPPVWNISAPRVEIQGMVEELSAKTVRLHDESIRLMKISAGFPEYGVDVDETHILLELNLPYFYQRQKGCYPGQEVIERILAYGKGRTPRTLCKLILEGEHKVEPKTEIFAISGEKAGLVTSSVFNPLDRKTIVLAYIEHKFVDGAAELEMKGEMLTLGS